MAASAKKVPRAPRRRPWQAETRAELLPLVDRIRKNLDRVDLGSSGYDERSRQLVDDVDELAAELVLMRCRRCGCTETHACEGGCSWVSLDPPLCSACVR